MRGPYRLRETVEDIPLPDLGNRAGTTAPLRPSARPEMGEELDGINFVIALLRTSNPKPACSEEAVEPRRGLSLWARFPDPVDFS